MRKHAKWLLLTLVAFVFSVITVGFNKDELPVILGLTVSGLVLSIGIIIFKTYEDKRIAAEEYKAYKERKEKELAEEIRKKAEEKAREMRIKSEEAHQVQLKEQQKKDEEARQARIDKINQIGFVEWYKQSVPDEELIDPLELDRYRYYEKRRQACGITNTLILRKEYDQVLEYRKSPEQRAQEEYLRNLEEENRRHEEVLEQVESDRQYHEEMMQRREMQHESEMQDREDERERERRAHNDELQREALKSAQKTAKYAAAYQAARIRGEDQSKASLSAWSESQF